MSIVSLINTKILNKNKLCQYPAYGGFSLGLITHNVAKMANMWLISLSNTRTYKLTHTPTVAQGGRGSLLYKMIRFSLVMTSFGCQMRSFDPASWIRHLKPKIYIGMAIRDNRKC